MSDSDSWTDPSGIDGNYDDSDDNGDSNEPDEDRESSDTRDSSESIDLRDIDNIRDVWNARTCYVSDDLAADIDKAWLEMQTALVDTEHNVKKNRHFYPIVLKLGIESLRDTDDEELNDML